MNLRMKGIVVAASALCVAGSAQAYTIFLDSYGTWNLIPMTSLWTQSETVLYPPSFTDVLPALNTMSLTGLVLSPPTGTATITYSNTAGTESLTVAANITDQQYSGNTGDIFSMDGNWTYVTGTGHYAPTAILSGSGTFANTQTNVNDDSGPSGTVLAGDLNPVPEPASLAALGLGIAALVRRRRR